MNATAEPRPGANPGPSATIHTMSYIVSYEDGRPTEPHEVLAAALEHAREHNRGQAWMIGETQPDGPPRVVASGLPAGARQRPNEAGHVDDGAIAKLVAAGREDLAREFLGDKRIDDWFREQGVDPDAARSEPGT